MTGPQLFHFGWHWDSLFFISSTHICRIFLFKILIYATQVPVQLAMNSVLCYHVFLWTISSVFRQEFFHGSQEPSIHLFPVRMPVLCSKPANISGNHAVMYSCVQCRPCSDKLFHVTICSSRSSILRSSETVSCWKLLLLFTPHSWASLPSSISWFLGWH
jgi:hypothetical protein